MDISFNAEIDAIQTTGMNGKAVRLTKEVNGTQLILRSNEQSQGVCISITINYGQQYQSKLVVAN